MLESQIDIIKQADTYDTHSYIFAYMYYYIYAIQRKVSPYSFNLDGSTFTSQLIPSTVLWTRGDLFCCTIELQWLHLELWQCRPPIRASYWTPQGIELRFSNSPFRQNHQTAISIDTLNLSSESGQNSKHLWPNLRLRVNSRAVASFFFVWDNNRKLCHRCYFVERRK